MFVTETYDIQDCKYANDMTSADSTHWTIPSSANATYSSDGMHIQGSAWSDCYLEIPLDKPMSIMFDITSNGSTGNVPPFSTYIYDASNKDRKYHVFYEVNAHKLINDYYNNMTNASGSFTLPSAFNLEIKVKSDSIEVYLDGGLYVTKSNYSLVSPFIFGVTTASNRHTTYKNLKIKPL